MSAQRNTAQQSLILAGLRPGAILAGVAVDWALSFLLGMLTLMIFLDPAYWNADESLFDAAIIELYAHPPFLFASLTTGLCATVAGACFGAHRAGIVHLKHGLAIALVSTGAAVLLFGLSDEQARALPVWYNATGWLAVLPAGVLGGYLARR